MSRYLDAPVLLCYCPCKRIVWLCSHDTPEDPDQIGGHCPGGEWRVGGCDRKFPAPTADPPPRFPICRPSVPSCCGATTLVEKLCAPLPILRRIGPIWPCGIRPIHPSSDGTFGYRCLAAVAFRLLCKDCCGKTVQQKTSGSLNHSHHKTNQILI